MSLPVMKNADLEIRRRIRESAAVVTPAAPVAEAPVAEAPVVEAGEELFAPALSPEPEEKQGRKKGGKRK